MTTNGYKQQCLSRKLHRKRIGVAKPTAENQPAPHQANAWLTVATGVNGVAKYYLLRHIQMLAIKRRLAQIVNRPTPSANGVATRLPAGVRRP